MEKKMNWTQAELALYRRIAGLALHPSAASSMIIELKLKPLAKRFEAGERTAELYAELMAEGEA